MASIKTIRQIPDRSKESSFVKNFFIFDLSFTCKRQI